MTPLGILLENVHTDGAFIGKCAYRWRKTLQQQDSGCDLDKMFTIGFALRSRISKITNIKNILIFGRNHYLFAFHIFGADFYGVSFLD